MSATGTAGSSDMSLTVLMIVKDQDRSRDFYHNVLGAEIVRDRAEDRRPAWPPPRRSGNR